ncbi:CBO0543 family protein [Halalkalibacter kiskunsagensis]|uniref:CBO0543 family protein n=1 Tax=Halalkalibacter kiskunsagensis TaxID=1548599 RepID=A0ABV6KBS3_9BACI
MNHSPSWEEISNIRETLRDAYMTYWLNNNLFSFGWWAVLIINLLFIYIAWKLLDRTRLFELLTVGGLIILFSTVIDVIGLHFQLFSYPTSLTPTIPSFFVADYITLPVIYMLLYQYFSTWKSFITANIITTIVLAFVIENLLRWLNIYQYIQWNSFYSFIVYFLIGIILKWIMNNLTKAQNKYTVSTN